MTSLERVRRCVEWQRPDVSPFLCWSDFAKSDIVASWAGPSKGRASRDGWKDPWGCEWKSVDSTSGQVVAYPIASPEDYADYRIPEPEIDELDLRLNHEEYGDRVCFGGLSYFFFERLEKIRGFNEAMMDMAAERDLLDPFLDRMQEYYISMVDLYADSGLVSCIGVNEDLGLQDRLTISPAMWREIFKPRYQAVYRRIHEHGLIVFQHSCGHVQDIIADLAEIGVDILELQQLNSMDMEVVAERRGRMTITAPVDIQAVLTTGDWPRIEAFQKRLFRVFDTPEGGYIPQVYCDLPSLGIPAETIRRLKDLIMRLCRWRNSPAILAE